MIGRRSFICNSVMVLAASVFADLFPVPAAPRPLSPELPARQYLPRATEANAVVFKIEGWSAADDGVRGTADHVWIRIGHSWRTAWR
jgi:hypothetical protein